MRTSGNLDSGFLESPLVRKQTARLKINDWRTNQNILLHFAGQSQLWKLNGKILENSARVWESTDEWSFKQKDKFENGNQEKNGVSNKKTSFNKQISTDKSELIYIENISKKIVLGITLDGRVFEENKPVEEELERLWIKGEPNPEG